MVCYYLWLVYDCLCLMFIRLIYRLRFDCVLLRFGWWLWCGALAGLWFVVFVFCVLLYSLIAVLLSGVGTGGVVVCYCVYGYLVLAGDSGFVIGSWYCVVWRFLIVLICSFT